LTDAQPDQLRVGVAAEQIGLARRVRPSRAGRRQSVGDLLPERSARLRAEIVALASDNLAAEVPWLGNPQLLGPEERFDEDDAADVGILPLRDRPAAQPGDAVPDRLVRRRPVLRAERLPGEAERQ